MPGCATPRESPDAPRFFGDSRGSLIGATFPEEEQTVLFLPCSGEVLLCATACWEEVVESGVLDPAVRELPEYSADAENLLATLDRLGIDLS